MRPAANGNRECLSTDLKSYGITFFFTQTKEKYEGIIELLQISKLEEEFCGFWYQAELSDGRRHEYYGYKQKSIYISLHPEIADAGLALSFNEESKWEQKGLLGRESLAGVIEMGGFTIYAK